MTDVKLSPRLQTLASFVETDDVVTDIGADHGYLSIWLAGHFGHKTYATEYGKGPFYKLLDNVHDFGASEFVFCYQADGLDGLREDSDTLIIAGMGGKTICGMLDSPSMSHVRKIITEPQSEAFVVRERLLCSGFKIIDEVYVTEKRKAYPVIVAIRGAEETPYLDYEMEFGRIPLAKKDPILKEFLVRQENTLSAYVESGKLAEKTKVNFELIKKALSLY